MLWLSHNFKQWQIIQWIKIVKLIKMARKFDHFAQTIKLITIMEQSKKCVGGLKTNASISMFLDGWLSGGK